MDPNKCPVCDWDIHEGGITVTVAGKTVTVCCDDCANKMRSAEADAPEEPSEEMQDFLRRFRSFWANPSGARIRELLVPDAQVHFAGQGLVSGEGYVELMDALLEGVESIRVEVMDYAQRGDRLFLYWKATRLAGGKQVEWHGVDRFRIEDGMAVEEQVIFDTGVLGGN